jgi:GTP-binding protein Era
LTVLNKALITIHATIFIERDSQKGIVVGRKGSKLQEIGTSARKDIEELLGQKVLLKLWVKVKKNWTKNSSFLKELGF